MGNKNRGKHVMGNDDIAILVVATLVIGLMIGNLWFATPMYYSLTQLCNEKYGVGGWTHSTINGHWTGADGTVPAKTANYQFWVCDPLPKDEVVCKLDILGIERCNQ